MSVVGYVLRARLRQRWRCLVLDAANARQVLVSTEDGGGYEALDDVAATPTRRAAATVRRATTLRTA